MKYDSLQRLIGVSNKASAGGAVLSQFTYGYGNTAAGTDSNGNATGFRDNRIGVLKQYGDVAADAQTTSYGYNTVSMLKGESAVAKTADLPAVSNSYSFDAMGNRTQWSDGVAKTLTNAVYNRLNQLTGTSSYDNTTPATPVLTSTSAFGYDGDGNMTDVVTTDGTTTTNGIYRYDDASRLIAIETPGQSKTEFFYDGMSRLRVSRTWAWQGGAWVPQAEKRRVYVGMDVVQERDGSNAVTASYARTGNISGILARTTSSGSSFFGYDGAGNVTTLTDGSGAQVGSYTYEAWGNIVASSGAKAGENPYRFSTKEAIGGLYSYGLRFYSPGLGRWINRDPIGEIGGSNIYLFVSDNPLQGVDYTGLFVLAITGAIIGGVIGSTSGAVGDLAYQVITNHGDLSKINGAEVGGAFVAGGIVGAVVGGVTGGAADGTDVILGTVGGATIIAGEVGVGTVVNTAAAGASFPVIQGVVQNSLTPHVVSPPSIPGGPNGPNGPNGPRKPPRCARR